MTVAVRGGQWSDAGLELPDGFGAAVIDEMAEFAPCAVWDPARAEVHACVVHAAALAEEVDRRHFELGLVGPDAWLDDHQVELLWDAHLEARSDRD